MFLKTTMMTVITSLMLSLTPTINATTTDFSKIVSQGITSGKKLLNITENKSYYFVIDSAYKLTRISKADGTKKAMSLPEGYEFGAYIKVEVSDDQKTLLADAGFRTVYVDLEKLKVISSIYKDVSEVPP